MPDQVSYPIQILLDEVAAELERAEAKHPGWPNDPFHGLAIIGEELGELNQAVLQCVYEGRADFGDIQNEAIQVAAMAIRFVKGMDHYRFTQAEQK